MRHHSDDPKCLCHPRPKKPFQKLELTLRGSNHGEVCHLDQRGAQLDVVFDLIGNAMSLRETIGDPSNPNTSYSICFLLDSKMWRFDNLKGLADNSLHLSFSMRNSFCAATGKHKMSYKEKYQGFSPNRLESKLYNGFYQCNWSEQHLELFMPAERIMGWKTVALILKTFKCISAENWCHMIKLENKPGVAGLDWKAIEKDVMPQKKWKEEPAPMIFSEEDRKMNYIFEKKKAAAKRAFQKQALLVPH
ncbi:uncharacterized protein BDV17DRAFT_300237 [Aspergillus undulatus]|uniref:uncharacterized protein n=1 Tax=Aspergillus undulatus TaxID=1810928 RepID=UPI003CCDC8B3